ncbi:hypothetical protein pb186bvf_003740 [Paramecium bursaria]
MTRGNADVIALQEVAVSQIDFLAGEYQKFFAPIQIVGPSVDPDYKSEGNLFLVKPHIQVQDHKYFHISVFRNFQVIQINNLLIVNTHLHHIIEEHQIRAHQLLNIWVYLNKFPNQEIAFMGDFNLFPNSEEYQTLSKYFKSSYLTVHGKEPDSTFPTGLTGPYMDTDPGGTLDYIWLRGNIVPLSIKIIGDQKIEEGVYPSDHMGLVGEFKL